MNDLNYIINNKGKVQELYKRKLYNIDLTEFVQLIERKRELINITEQNQSIQNKLSKSVPEVKKNGGNVEDIFKQVKELANLNNEYKEELKNLENKINEIYFALPNIPDEDLLPGGKENNKVIYKYKDKPEFNFKIKDHVELAESLGLIDYKKGAKISGSGTWVYTNLGARLEWALINFFINEHLSDGYEFILPPHLLNYDSGFTAGQFPKFEEDVFVLKDTEPKKFLLPTAETALVNLHRNDILNLSELPRKYFSYTPCYRKEAGSYRTEERGMIRGYQFNKVEMVQYTENDKSDVAFDELIKKAQTLLEKLGLHYQMSKLAAGDCSHSMARTYDLEVWLPSVGIYKEVSSVSNARDYQARRGKMRYKDSEGKTQFCHTLNGSGLATSRIFPALLEQYQQEDGSVLVPEVLQPYMGGIKIIRPKNN